ncbi:unnamed protein product [Bemisia tabaci]|uniref:Uncharacterized protein n=1 Tax=Bemisia tabaci TaxID=7038 RepID=A0A9P0AJU7_BEMTA|nr:unnamed protein product [Bemisia tabaci]
MARGPLPPCLFNYHDGFIGKQACKKLSNNSTQPVMKIFILFNYVYFGCLAALFLYDVLFYKIFSFGRFVFTNCFKKCPACDDLKDAKKVKRRISFSLPAPEEHPSQQRVSESDQRDTSNLNEESDLHVNSASEIPGPVEDPHIQFLTNWSRNGVENAGTRWFQGARSQQPAKPEFVRTQPLRPPSNEHAYKEERRGYEFLPQYRNNWQSGYEYPLREQRIETDRAENLRCAQQSFRGGYAGARNLECHQTARTKCVDPGAFGNGYLTTGDPRVYRQNFKRFSYVPSRKEAETSDAYDCASYDRTGNDRTGNGCSSYDRTGNDCASFTSRGGSPETERLASRLTSGSEGGRLRSDDRCSESPIRPVMREVDLDLLPRFVRNILKKSTEANEEAVPGECETNQKAGEVAAEEDRSQGCPGELNQEH